jgi:hypothetical protein
MGSIASSLIFLISWQESPPTAEQIEERVLAHRRAIKSGQVELTSTAWLKRRSADEITYRRTTTVWFDGKRIRGDRIRPYDQTRPGADGSTFREVSCFADGKHFFYTDVVPPGGGSVVVHITDRAKKEKDPLWQVVDPRLIGLAPDASTELTKYHDEFVLLRKDRQPPELGEDVVSGLPAYRLTYRRMDHYVYKYWVVPERGFSVVKLEETRPDGSLESRLECEIELHQKSGEWFPKSAKFERLPSPRGGTRYGEELAVTVVQLNEPVADEVFTLKGMDIPKGQHVSSEGNDTVGGLIWNGKEVVAAEARLELPPDQDSSATGAQRWYLAASLFLAVLASVAIWKVMPQRRSVAGDLTESTNQLKKDNARGRQE